MNNVNKPSIFTSKESLKRRYPTAPSYPNLHTPTSAGSSSQGENGAAFGSVKPRRPSSPLRRVSTPEYIERGRVRAQEEEQEWKSPKSVGRQSRHGGAGAGDAAARARPTLQAAATILGVETEQWKLARTQGPNRDTGISATGTSAAATQWTLPALTSKPVDAIDNRTRFVKRTRANSLSSGASTKPSVSGFAEPTTPTTSGRGRKRAAESLGVPGGDPSNQPLQKIARATLRSKHVLDVHSFAPTFIPHEPPSPLFFSHSPRPRPQLPARFSSSEAAVKMLSKAKADESRVKTVSLARGMVSTPSTGNIPTSAPRDALHRQSVDRSSTGRSASPDAFGSMREGRDGSINSKGPLGSILSNIGVIELLDQDERPTFIVDLSDSRNYGQGHLHPVFLNASLRSYGGMMDLVTGNNSGSDSPGPDKHLQFKSWLLSAAVNGESLNVCLPGFSFAGMTWSCSTLRKRLRIISGAFTTHVVLPERNDSYPASLPPGPMTTLADIGTSISAPASTMKEVTNEASDYFSPAMSPNPPTPAPAILAKAASTEVIPTIEDSTAGKSPKFATLPNGSTARLNPDTPDDPNASTAMLPSPSFYQSGPPSDGVLTIPTPSGSSSNNMEWASSHLPLVPVDAPSFDWTRLPVTDSMPQHIRFARSINWAATSLGPIESWSSDLRQMCNLIMASPYPAAMYWGDDLVAIYNEAYVLLAGQKHPKLMGMPYRLAWAEIWEDVKDVFASARMTGQATMKDDDCLFIKRNDYLEETYFSWSIIPMVGSDGSVMGLYNPAFEKTRRKIAERRMLTLREVGERTASARDVKAFWREVLESWEFNEFDSPFLLLYSVTDELDSDSSSMHSNSVFGTRQCLLEGSLGIPDDHPAAPEQIDLRSGTEGFGPVFREMSRTDKPILLEVGSRDLPDGLLDGLDCRGFGDPVKAAIVCPINPTTGESVLGFLVLGVNPRRPYDDDYSLFLQLLSRQLATSLASVVLFEEEIRRGQKAAKLAALDRIELSEQLAARTQEAIESETRFTRMAEFAPVGMFITGSDGRITFANDTWYDISRVAKNGDMADTWMNSIHPDDVEIVKGLWHQLVIDTKPVSSEFRFKADWMDRDGNRSDTWVLFSAFPERYPLGEPDRNDSLDGRSSGSGGQTAKLKSIFGVITNISQQKWAEGFQRRRMEEAVEMKRQQENFIDITSHEMRNPLSAILQCSDEITQIMTKLREQTNGAVDGAADDDAKPATLPDSVINDCLDAAQTISLCSQHQKRIVDDILTLSKLDSALLLVTPVDAQPLMVVQRALKMHEGELQAADIQMRFVVDPSFKEMNLNWVRFDPSRVMQVLINLTTNAIKFTTTEKKRTITVTVAASKDRPSARKDAVVNYFPTRSKRPDITFERDWGDGDKVYVHFAVQDTGRGLSPEEKKLLFLRFSQASPRTHVQYGGSGLGLFISRELTELQGGEIGVESEAGKGSTFAFYVAARRSLAPADTANNLATPANNHQRVPSDAVGKKDALQRANSGNKIPKVSSKKADFVRKVLIVEDNLVNQRVLKKQLINLGTEVHVANHGGEALDQLRQSTYWAASKGGKLDDNNKKVELGVVLMDQEMPIMDGLTCTKKIRELEKEGVLIGHVPIIAVTANARSEQIKTALDAGMDDIICKPFKIPDLLPKIEELMEKYPMPLADAS